MTSQHFSKLKDFPVIRSYGTKESHSKIISIDPMHIVSRPALYEKTEYDIQLYPQLVGLSLNWTICAFRIYAEFSETLGLFLKQTDKTGFTQSLFGFPGDFFMGNSGNWIEPIYPIPLALAVSSKMSMNFSIPSTQMMPRVELYLHYFSDVTPIYPQVFVYKTKKNGEDCAIVGGIYYPQYGFKQKRNMSSELLPISYKIIPSIKILHEKWLDVSQYQIEFVTVKQLEENVTAGLFGGGFNSFEMNTDFDTNSTRFVQ